jgi:heme-degrading monooxygenase HmoA
VIASSELPLADARHVPVVPSCIPRGTPVIVEYLRYTVPAGREDEFVDAYRQAAACLERSSHSLAYEVAQCVEDPTTFVVRLEWDSAEGHLEGFRRSPEFPGFFQAVQPFFHSIQEMRHYEVTPVRAITPAGVAAGHPR